MLERNEIANFSLYKKQVTIFAPTNEAFQKNQKPIDNDNLVLYHMINLAKTVTELSSQYNYVTSELDGNPPLWITLRRGTYHDDHYINNARILQNQSNYKARNAANTEDQVLHKIDEVLVPVFSPKSSADRLFNPNAWDFIAKFESFNFKTYRIRTFRQRINQTNKAEIFKNEGGHTFFIPIDDGFKDSKPESVDGKVIDGHVIPKRVLFTEPTMKDYMFETLAESDNIRVFISFSQDTESKSKTIYIKSHTRVSEGNITKGVVIAAIKEANIPVKNGVIHLIHKPLMIVDHSVKQFLEAVQVLERHLIVGDVALTMEKIKAMANDTSISYGKEIYTNKKETELETVRDSLKIAVEERINSFFGTQSHFVMVFRETMSVKQKEGAGRAEKRTEELVNNVREIISNAPRTSVRTLSQQVGVSIGTCHTILKKDLPVIKKSRKSTIPEE
ncbi:periostin-related [Holotrichia oblita]|uniref:Periostin-related n=1 Tax=Holotrichia oblita TaxID=644536 RepID=A0ACB9SZ11_HOLOL|nr:periostin-related [Holotrichia oblita]